MNTTLHTVTKRPFSLARRFLSFALRPLHFTRKTPGPEEISGGIFLVHARQQGKTVAMHQVLMQDAVKIHDTEDGRCIAIHRTPDMFSDKCKITITRRLPYAGNPILQKTLHERFPSVNAAMRYCQFVFGITEWNIQ